MTGYKTMQCLDSSLKSASAAYSSEVLSTEIMAVADCACFLFLSMPVPTMSVRRNHLAFAQTSNGDRQESLRKALKQAIAMGVRRNGDETSQSDRHFRWRLSRHDVL